jgi:hypothetical protein
LMLACALFFGVSGAVTDYLLNAPFREPVLAINKVIQFANDTRGTQVDPSLARSMYLGSVSGISDLTARPRRLFVSSFAQTLDEVDILVDFDGTLVQCITIANKPAFCRQIP